jgi:hypothetical protein
VTTNWRAKVFKSRRTWKATVTEQIPDRKIAWTSEGAKGSTKGVVTFHPLADDLTQVLLVLEYNPQGLFEKTGNLWRAQGRRARLDLKNFRRFIMTRGEATGSWRGEIRDGEVVRGPDEEEPAEDRSQQADEGQEQDEAQEPEEGQEPDEDRDEDRGEVRGEGRGEDRGEDGDQARDRDRDEAGDGGRDQDRNRSEEPDEERGRDEVPTPRRRRREPAAAR